MTKLKAFPGKSQWNTYSDSGLQGYYERGWWITFFMQISEASAILSSALVEGTPVVCCVSFCDFISRVACLLSNMDYSSVKSLPVHVNKCPLGSESRATRQESSHTPSVSAPRIWVCNHVRVAHNTKLSCSAAKTRCNDIYRLNSAQSCPWKRQNQCADTYKVCPSERQCRSSRCRHCTSAGSKLRLHGPRSRHFKGYTPTCR